MSINLDALRMGYFILYRNEGGLFGNLIEKQQKKKGRYKIAFWAASNCNLGYDWFGILKFKLKFMFHQKRMFFCSENALWSLQKEFPGALGMKPEKCMPSRFLRDEFELVWEGEI